MRVGILSVPCATFLNFLYGALPCRRYFARLSKSFLISSIGNHKVQQYFKNLSFRSLFVLVTNMVLRNRMLWKGSKLSNNSNHFRFLLSHKQLLISRRKRILKLFFFTDRTEDVIIRNDRASITWWLAKFVVLFFIWWIRFFAIQAHVSVFGK